MEITQAGIGGPDGCWVWHGGALHQIQETEGRFGEITTLRLECDKGDWSFIASTSRDSALWLTLAELLVQQKLLMSHTVVP